jgi:hypothetical protein
MQGTPFMKKIQDKCEAVPPGQSFKHPVQDTSRRNKIEVVLASFLSTAP